MFIKRFLPSNQNSDSASRRPTSCLLARAASEARRWKASCSRCITPRSWRPGDSWWRRLRNFKGRLTNICSAHSRLLAFFTIIFDPQDCKKVQVRSKHGVCKFLSGRKSVCLCLVCSGCSVDSPSPLKRSPCVNCYCSLLRSSSLRSLEACS